MMLRSGGSSAWISARQHLEGRVARLLLAGLAAVIDRIPDLDVAIADVERRHADDIGAGAGILRHARFVGRRGRRRHAGRGVRRGRGRHRRRGDRRRGGGGARRRRGRARDGGRLRRRRLRLRRRCRRGRDDGRGGRRLRAAVVVTAAREQRQHRHRCQQPSRAGLFATLPIHQRSPQPSEKARCFSV